MANTIIDIKRALDKNVGKRITIKANGGRRRSSEQSGMIEETYPAVFIVKLDEDQNSVERVSYSYADVLTETVELFLSGENGQKATLQEYLLVFDNGKQEILLHDYSKNPELLPFSMIGTSKQNNIHFEILYREEFYSRKKIQLLADKYCWIVEVVLRNSSYTIKQLEDAYADIYVKK